MTERIPLASPEDSKYPELEKQVHRLESERSRALAAIDYNDSFTWGSWGSPQDAAAEINRLYDDKVRQLRNGARTEALPNL